MKQSGALLPLSGCRDDAPYDLQWACAAHLQAVLAVAGAAAGSAGAAEDERWAAVLRRVLAVAVQHCSRYIDNAWDCAVDQAFEHVAMHAAEVSCTHLHRLACTAHVLCAGWLVYGCMHRRSPTTAGRVPPGV